MASLASFGGLGLNTATCHHIGGLYGVPHGEANAILLPHTMRYNLDACADRQRLIAEAIGVAEGGMSDEEAGLAAADAVDWVVPGAGAAAHAAGGGGAGGRAGIHCGGHAARPEFEFQPQARPGRGADNGSAAGGVLTAAALLWSAGATVADDGRRRRCWGGPGKLRRAARWDRLGGGNRFSASPVQEFCRDCRHCPHAG